MRTSTSCSRRFAASRGPGFCTGFTPLQTSRSVARRSIRKSATRSRRRIPMWPSIGRRSSRLLSRRPIPSEGGSAGARSGPCGRPPKPTAPLKGLMPRAGEPSRSDRRQGPPRATPRARRTPSPCLLCFRLPPSMMSPRAMRPPEPLRRPTRYRPRRKRRAAHLPAAADGDDEGSGSHRPRFRVPDPRLRVPRRRPTASRPTTRKRPGTTKPPNPNPSLEPPTRNLELWRFGTRVSEGYNLTL